MAEKNTEEKKTFADNASGFLTKYRVLFIGVIVALIVVAIVWGIISSMTTPFTLQNHRQMLPFSLLYLSFLSNRQCLFLQMTSYFPKY